MNVALLLDAVLDGLSEDICLLISLFGQPIDDDEFIFAAGGDHGLGNRIDFMLSDRVLLEELQSVKTQDDIILNILWVG